MPSAEYLRNWRHSHPESVREHSRTQRRKQIRELKPAYLRKQLATRVNPTTIEQLKTRIQIRRAQRLLKPMAAANLITK